MSLILMSPGSFVRCLSVPFFITPRAPTITGTTCVLRVHILLISISKSLYFDSFSVNLVEVFRSDGTDTSMSVHVLVSWSLITMSGLNNAIIINNNNNYSIIIIIIIIHIFTSACAFHSGRRVQPVSLGLPEFKITLYIYTFIDRVFRRI